jgi:hypothetical protein
MYLIPYVRKTGLSLVFLSDGGKRLWETEETLAPEEYIQEYFEPNGLRGRLQPSPRKDVILFEVDTAMTRLEEFYSLLDETVPAGVDLWRPFFWVEGAEPERRLMSLGRFGTAADLGLLLA